MQLPPFNDFLASFDLEKMDYDIKRLSTPELKRPNSLFTQEQYTFLCQTMSTMNLAMLQQYHQWLAEQLEI